MLRRVHTRLLLLVAASALFALGFWACAAEEPQAKSDEGTLELVASPKRAAADGRSVDVSILALEADGAPGSGSAVVRPAAGLVGGQALATIELTEGKASFKWVCDAAQDPECDGPLKITATWKEVVAAAEVEWYTAPTVDGGTSDSGTVNPPTDGGETTTDAGVADAGEPEPVTGTGGTSLILKPDKDRLFAQVGDYADLTATLTVPVADGGFRPVADAGVSFVVNNLGGFVSYNADAGAFEEINADAGTGLPKATFQTFTDSAGKAIARFRDDGRKGIATITASNPSSGASAVQRINIGTVNQLSYVSTTCAGAPCNVMGVKGFGYNEQALVTFQIKDAFDSPAPGVKVVFSIDDKPAGTTFTSDGVTDETGKVSTSVSAGEIIGAFQVKATAIANVLQASSPTIGIRGVVPSNHAFSLECQQVNIPALISAQADGIADMSVGCNVKLVDRYNNAIATGTAVNFKPEAGTTETDKRTQAYVADGDNSNEGKATVKFDTVGEPPLDVPPLLPLAGQYPFPRDPEPKNTVTSDLIRNPRDGLVTILAYVRGQEYFSDENKNGRRDPAAAGFPGEKFIDQGEPFVDKDDDNERGPDEFYIDTNNNGRYDPPNGQWDERSTIWTEARVLYTSAPYCDALHTYLRVPPGCPGTCGGFGDTCEEPQDWPADAGKPPKIGGLTPGAVIDLELAFPDLNLNRLSKETEVKVSMTSKKGAVTFYSRIGLDGYGFELERKLVKIDPVTKAWSACGKSDRCEWRTYFGQWFQGYAGEVSVTGADPADESDCEATTVEATACNSGVCCIVRQTGYID